MSLDAQYELLAFYRAQATAAAWEALGADGRREAVELWEERKARERAREERKRRENA